jgi:glycosyltransferase involved in cell wall biosynthesis
MRVGIDVTPLLPMETGVDRYLLQFVHFLARIDSKTQYTIFINTQDAGRYAGLGGNFTLLPVGIRGRAGRLFAQQLIVPALARSRRLDVIHSTSFFIPFYRGRSRHLLTVFDMTMFTRGGCHTRLRRSRPFVSGIASSIRRCHQVVVPSSFVRQEVMRLLPDVDPDKIRVIPLGVDPEFRPCDAGAGPPPAFPKVKSPYILCVGTIEPRKNLPMLLEAYRAALANYGLQEQLLLAGRRGWDYGPVERLTRSEELRHRVHLLGYVERGDLIRLYQNASLFVYPSLEEGFGLPPLEAMACGIPTIATETSSLKENLSAAALLVPPDSPAALSDALAAVLTRPELHAKLKERGLALAREFRWEITAGKTLDCYRELAQPNFLSGIPGHSGSGISASSTDWPPPPTRTR